MKEDEHQGGLMGSSDEDEGVVNPLAVLSQPSFANSHCLQPTNIFSMH